MWTTFHPEELHWLRRNDRSRSPCSRRSTKSDKVKSRKLPICLILTSTERFSTTICRARLAPRSYFFQWSGHESRDVAAADSAACVEISHSPLRFPRPRPLGRHARSVHDREFWAAIVSPRSTRCKSQSSLLRHLHRRTNRPVVPAQRSERLKSADTVQHGPQIGNDERLEHSHRRSPQKTACVRRGRRPERWFTRCFLRERTGCQVEKSARQMLLHCDPAGYAAFAPPCVTRIARAVTRPSSCRPSW